MFAAVLGGVGLFLTFARPIGRTATLTWDYDYSKDPACGLLIDGKPLENKCVEGFNVFTREGSERPVQVFFPNRQDPSGKTVNKTIRATIPVHRYGRLEFCVSSIGKDVDGHSSESEPACMRRWVLPLLKD